MVILKIVRHSNGGQQYMENMLSYILDDRALFTGFNGISSYGTNQEIIHNAMEEMLFVKKYFGKMSGNPLIQFVFSYDSNVSDAFMASSITEKIARFLADSYQYIWVVHYRHYEEAYGNLAYACMKVENKMQDFVRWKQKILDEINRTLKSIDGEHQDLHMSAKVDFINLEACSVTQSEQLDCVDRALATWVVPSVSDLFHNVSSEEYYEAKQNM